MHLYCMRHGEAYTIESNPQQPLTPQGQNDVALIAKFLSRQSVNIEHIIHSGKLRAQQTAEIMAEHLSVSQVSVNRLLAGGDDLESVVRFIEQLSEDTLLVSHLPLIDHLVQSLTMHKVEQDTLINYQPGTIVRLVSCHNQSWLLDWIINPSVIN